MMRKIEIEFSFDHAINEKEYDLLVKALKRTVLWTTVNQKPYAFSALYSCKPSKQGKCISYGKFKIQFTCSDSDFNFLACIAQPDTNLPYYALNAFLYLRSALKNSCVRIVTISNYTQIDNAYELVSQLKDDNVENYLNESSSTGSNSFSSIGRNSLYNSNSEALKEQARGKYIPQPTAPNPSCLFCNIM